MGAKYEVRGSVAVITLDNPPVTGLGYDTRTGIASGIAQASADPAVVAVVITGGGRAFSGGADIKEFGSLKAVAEPNLLSLIKLLEDCQSPWWPPSTASAWVAGLNWRWAATTAWPRRVWMSHCRK